MLKRRSHNKSRNGCSNCKRRHVKCDEQGPPCLNCVVRETSSDCEYVQATQSALGPLSSSPSAHVHIVGGGLSSPLPPHLLHYDGSSPGSSGVSISLSAASPGPSGIGRGLSNSSSSGGGRVPSTSSSRGRSSAPPSRGSTPPQPASSATSAARGTTPTTNDGNNNETNRLMDIELMHRWSTMTYKSFISVNEDHAYMQVEIPREAMRHEYLLNGLLALTALEKVMTEAKADEAREQQQAAQQRHHCGGGRHPHAQQHPHIDPALAGYGGGGGGAPNGYTTDVDMLGAGSGANGGINGTGAGGLGIDGAPGRPYGASNSSPTGNHHNSNNNAGATSTTARVYVRAAMEYYDRAIAGFRAALSTMSPSSQHTLFFSSLLAALFHLLMPRCIAVRDREAQRAGEEPFDSSTSGGSGSGPGGEHSAVAHMVSLFDLLNGSSSIALSSWGGLLESPLGASMVAALSLGLPDMYALDPDVDAALRRLAVLAAATGPAIIPPGHSGSPGEDGTTAPAEALLIPENLSILLDGTLTGPLPESVPSDVVAKGTPPRTDAERRRDMYRNTVFYLRYGFAESSRAAYKFAGVGFPLMGGREFAGAVARREPLAMLIVAYWGVMLGLESNVAWWTESVGRGLVAEISESLVLLEMRGQLTDGLGRMPEWRESISWARTRVGLPAL